MAKNGPPDGSNQLEVTQLLEQLLLRQLLRATPAQLATRDQGIAGLYKSSQVHGGVERLTLAETDRVSFKAKAKALRAAVANYEEALADLRTDVLPGGAPGRARRAVEIASARLPRPEDESGLAIADRSPGASAQLAITGVLGQLNGVHTGYFGAANIDWLKDFPRFDPEDFAYLATHYADVLEWTANSDPGGAQYATRQPTIAEAKYDTQTAPEGSPLRELSDWLNKAQKTREKISATQANITKAIETTTNQDQKAVLNAEIAKLELASGDLERQSEEVAKLLETSTTGQLLDARATYPSAASRNKWVPILGVGGKIAELAAVLTEWEKAEIFASGKFTATENAVVADKDEAAGIIEARQTTLYSKKVGDEKILVTQVRREKSGPGGKLVWEYQGKGGQWLSLEESDQWSFQTQSSSQRYQTLYHPVTGGQRSLATAVHDVDGVPVLHVQAPVMEDGKQTGTLHWRPIDGSGWQFEAGTTGRRLKSTQVFRAADGSGTIWLTPVYTETVDGKETVVTGEKIQLDAGQDGYALVFKAAMDAYTKSKPTQSQMEALTVADAFSAHLGNLKNLPGIKTLSSSEKRNLIRDAWLTTYGQVLSTKDKYPANYEDTQTIGGQDHPNWLLDLLATAEDFDPALFAEVAYRVQVSPGSPRRVVIGTPNVEGVPAGAAAGFVAQGGSKTVIPAEEPTFVRAGTSIHSAEFADLANRAQNAAKTLAGKIGDPNEEMTLEMARENFGYLMTLMKELSRGEISPEQASEYQSIIDGFAGLTVTEAQKAVDRIILARQAQTTAEDAERQRTFTRARDQAQLEETRVANERKELLSMRTHISGMQQRQQEAITGVQKAIAAAQQGIAADYLQQAPGFGPITPGAKIGGAPIYEQLAERVGLVSPGYIPYGGPSPDVPQASDIQAFQEALAEARKKVAYTDDASLEAGLPTRKPISLPTD